MLVSDISEIEQSRAVKAIQNLVLVVYIVIPFALYTNVINSLKVNFTDELLILRIILALGIFVIISFILIHIENLLMPILLLDKNKVGYNNSIFQDIRNSIYLSVLFVFLIIVFIPIATDNTALNIHFSLYSLFLGIGYSLMVYYILYIPLKYTEEIVSKELMIYSVDNMTIGN